MIHKNGVGQVSELDFSDIYVIEKWIKKYIYEIKTIKPQLCRCKYDILRIKWHEIIYWFSLLCNRIIKDKKISVENFIDSIMKVIESYELIIKEDPTMSTKIFSLFRELHKVTTNEFASECEEFIEHFNENKMSVNELLDKIGESLYTVLINTIFELHEISVKCENAEYCELSDVKEDESIRFLINNLYNLNSYSIFKLKKFIEILNVDVSKIDFIADFKYFEEDSINPNIIKMLEEAKTKFKSLTITNVNSRLLQIMHDKFENDIA